MDLISIKVGNDGVVPIARTNANVRINKIGPKSNKVGNDCIVPFF